jgi:hypothetical protein
MDYFLKTKEDIETIKVPRSDNLNPDPFDVIYWFEGDLKRGIDLAEIYGNFTADDFKCLEKYFGGADVINYSKFQSDLNNSIEGQRLSMMGDLRLYEEHKFNFLIDLKTHLDFLDTAIKFLNFFETNKNEILSIVKQSYLLSYQKALVCLEAKYQQLYPNAFRTSSEILPDSTSLDKTRLASTFAKETLITVLFSDAVDDFFDNEARLIDDGYIVNSNWIERKDKLIVLVILLKHRKYINISRHKKLINVFKFFETRYSISLGDQRKPSKYEKLAINDSLFPYFKIQ